MQLEDSKKRVTSEDGSDTFQRAISLLDMEPNEVGQLCHCFRDGELVSQHFDQCPLLKINPLNCTSNIHLDPKVCTHASQCRSNMHSPSNNKRYIAIPDPN